jgi:hypothetical protein
MRYEDRPMGSITAKLGIVLVAIGAIGAVGYFLMKDNKASKLNQLPESTPIPVSTPAPEIVKKPVYEDPKPMPVPEPLPDLNQSDAAVITALKGLRVSGLVEMIVPTEILRKFVRAVDAVEDGKVVTEYRPIASPQGAFVADSFNVKVAGGELGETQDVEQFRVSPKNYLRYTLFTQVVSSLDSDAAVGVYNHFYPLINKAYQELGLNKGNFQSILIRAIDKVLAAPAGSGDMILVRPKVYYEFADPVLEKQSDINKLMLRMGPDNAEKIKTSLKNLRVKLLQK